MRWQRVWCGNAHSNPNPNPNPTNLYPVISGLISNTQPKTHHQNRDSYKKSVDIIILLEILGLKWDQFTSEESHRPMETRSCVGHSSQVRENSAAFHKPRNEEEKWLNSSWRREKWEKVPK